MTTDPRLLETLRRLATKGNPDTMPISLCPEGAALERIEQLDAENNNLRECVRLAVDHLRKDGQITTAQLLAERAAITAGYCQNKGEE
jgi:hypothetical protein